jgi:hypothetical protein
MSELQMKIDAATTRLLAVQQERADREASANAHEAQAREDRRVMTALKKESGELDAVLRHSQVQKTVEDAAAATFKAQSSAEEALARLEEKEKRLDELLAKAEAKPADAPTA